MNIFVAKMSSATTGEDLAALFGEHGTVTSAKVITDRETGNSKCFGFVEMEDETEGMNAINALNETEFQGRKIVVKKARPREEGERNTHRSFQRGGGERRFNSNH
ncbi:RNA-binding protein [uncultured Odoribacter sp.]|uniref:RNA recognition motif domain-containing protein n=1 Tax=uncultured Odoribacter sp. TaxID=876416 RepID=UPI00260E77A1|nr:RNA-binding protein [uncultured Odoribacter sp.]